MCVFREPADERTPRVRQVFRENEKGGLHSSAVPCSRFSPGGRVLMRGRYLSGVAAIPAVISHRWRGEVQVPP